MRSFARVAPRAALVATWLLTGPLTAQERPAAVFGTGVSLVQLPVFVVDREGRAARGLASSDFEVVVDGRRAEVVSFRYVDTTDADADEELQRSSAARRRFLLLFDKSFTDLAGLTRARRAAGELVRRKLADSDLVAVATFDLSQGIRLVANFTEDRALLAHAVETLGVPQLSRISDPLRLAATLQAADLQARPGADPEPQQLLDNISAVLVRQMRAAEAEQYRSHVQTLVAGLEDLGRALAGVEGRKQVVYFSAGFDSRFLVGEEGYDRETTSLSIEQGRLWEVDGQARFGDARVRERLAEATRLLARADAVVHTIDVTGFGQDESLQRLTPLQDGMRDTGGRESLSLVAADTGGRFFKDANDLAPALAEMLEMTSRYYVLGIQPEREKGPGSFHKLKVKVARKGVKVSHRPGFFEKGPAAARTALQRQFDLAELVMSGDASRDDLPFTPLCLPFPAPGATQTLGLVVQVPRESLAWAGEGVGLELYAYAVGDDGGVRDHLAQSLRLEPSRADPQDRARGLSLFGTLAVPAGRYTIRLMVRDQASGRSAVRLLDVTVPPYDGRSAFALPPLVLDEAERWLKLDLAPAGAARPGAEAPFRLAGSPFVPRASFEVRPGAQERLVLMVFHPELQGDPAADVEIRSSLTARDGQPVEPGRIKLERVHDAGDGRRSFVFSYLPDTSVAAGDYTLKIGLGEAGSYAQSYALLRVRAGS